MKNLFYSPTENRVFYVPNYYVDSDSNVENFIKNLMLHSKELADIVGGKIGDVKTDYIASSSRYKYMRAFYIEVDEKFEATEDSSDETKPFCLGNDWTMYKWLRN